MNADDAMLSELTTVQNEEAVDDSAPDALALPSFDYARVVKAVPGAAIGSARTPYTLTIAAQLAAMLRAQIRSGKLEPNGPIPSDSTLMQRYGVAGHTVRKAVRVLVCEGLVYVVPGRGVYVADRAE